MILRAALLSLFLGVRAAGACDLALVLAVDVSGSVDPQEYRLQMDGLAAALRDGVVAEALLNHSAMVTLIQWTGSSRQRQTLPWTAMTSFPAIEAFAAAVEDDPRIWRNYSTAIGEALSVGRAAFAEVPDCRRRVIDVSGDGQSNEGSEPRAMHDELGQDGIVVNAVAIETNEDDLTAYFFENVITGEGAFVETANGFEDYPAAILRKLQRETARATATRRHTPEKVPATWPAR
jgi:Ca-activated chloride channel family protein